MARCNLYLVTVMDSAYMPIIAIWPIHIFVFIHIPKATKIFFKKKIEKKSVQKFKIPNSNNLSWKKIYFLYSKQVSEYIFHTMNDKSHDNFFTYLQHSAWSPIYDIHSQPQDHIISIYFVTGIGKINCKCQFLQNISNFLLEFVELQLKKIGLYRGLRVYYQNTVTFIYITICM